MKFINNMKIGWRLNIILSLVMIITMSLLGIYTINMGKKTSIKDADTQMKEQINDLSKLIEVQLDESQKRVNYALNTAREVLYNEGNIIISNKESDILAQDQLSKATKKVKINAFMIGDQIVLNNYDIVDKINELTGATATIFQKIPSGYLRISTNVIGENGERAIGTYIPNNSTVVQSVESGQTYTGRAFVVGEYYLTSYEPIWINGKIEGMLYVGIKEKDLESIKRTFKEKKYFKTGYPFLAEASGLVIIHPNIEGQNLTGSQVFDLVSANKSNEVKKSSYIWEGQQKYLYSKYIERIDSFVAIGVTQAEFFETVVKTRNAILFAVFLGVLFFVLINSLISRNITRSLNIGVEFAERIASGDLKTNIDIDQKDEIGLLANSLNRMVEKLREIVVSINLGANNVASASQQISSSTQQLSEGATEQASSTEEVSSSMEEMASNIQQNTDNAQQTEKISINAANGMNQVASAAQESLTSVRQIAEKITIVNDIAFQTNILALNAAVEAARAGEHGKGFAVVAAEVRKLAERSKVAADEIITLSTKSVNSTEDAGKLMGNIIPDIEKTAKLVQEIAAASLEQNSGADQVNNAIQQLNTVTQQNAAASEEMATSSEELASQAEQLKEVVSFFKIDDNKRMTMRNAKLQEYKAKPAEAKPKMQNSQENTGFNIKLSNDNNLDNEFESF